MRRQAVLYAIPLVVAASATGSAQVSSGKLFSAPSQLANPVTAPSAPASPAAPATAIAGELLPGGTTVTVSLAEPLSSTTAEEGDQIAIVVRKPVVVDGYLFIPEGANGHATVTSVEHSGGNGSGGKLALTIDWVYAVDGGKIKLSQTNHASESGDTKGASSTATILSYLVLGPLGLFAHNFVHGKDATIPTKKTFVVFVDHDVHLLAKPYVPEPESTPR